MNNKSTALIWGLTLLLLLSATFAFARGPANVSNTIHNLSATSPSFVYLTDEQEVCIFCHTPHGGGLTGPLWNKADPAPSSVFYRSTTISATVNAVSAINPESLLCLSCHDGSVSVNHLLNYGQTYPIRTIATGDTNTEIVGTAGINMRIGGSPGDEGGTGQLGDDHPISFSYDDVLVDYTTASRVGLHSVIDAETAGVQFFGGNNRVECSSCHDPHVDYVADATFAPFLITPNAGSALCLACHDK